MADRLPPLDGLDPELLDRYLAGECTEEEVATVRRYLMVHPAAARELERFLRALDGEAGRPPAPDTAASWAVLRRRLHVAEPAVLPPVSPRAEPPPPGSDAAGGAPAGGHHHPLASFVRRQRTPWWRRAAAAAAVLALASAAALGIRRPVPPAEPPPAPRIYATSNRERAVLRLPDGTRVTIAPASRLRVSADFGTERRDVYLEGEAYFDVAHDERRPFTVFAGNASARDLGTGFLVRSYAEDDAVQVVVREGEVALSGVGRLGPGDLGRVGADGRTALRHGVVVENYLAWLDGRLVFQDAPLAEVLRALRRWHDVDVRLADSTLGALPFTGSLEDASARSAIDLVGATLGLRVRREGERVTLERVAGRTPRARSEAAPP